MDTTESEASSKSSKSDTYNLIFLATTKNKQLFVKTLKRACVVCKNFEDTVKCTGLCQSYFHKECLAKSEDRYNKDEPIIKVKKTPCRSKKHSTFAHKNGHVSDPLINIKEENADELYEKYDKFKSLNNTKSLSIEQCLSHSNEEDKLPDILVSNDLSKKKISITIDDESTQQLSELDYVDRDLIQETPEDTIIETSIKPTTTEDNELKYMCSLCKANKTNCFECGLDIEDSTQKIACKLCKLKLFKSYLVEKCFINNSYFIDQFVL